MSRCCTWRQAVDFYANHDRIRSGSTDAMLEAAYDAWEHDSRAGRRSLLLASSGSDVTALNLRARGARVEATVERTGHCHADPDEPPPRITHTGSLLLSTGAGKGLVQVGLPRSVSGVASGSRVREVADPKCR